LAKRWKIAAALWLAVFVVLGDGAVRGAHAANPECRGSKLAGAEGTPRQVRRLIWCVANKLPHVTARKAVAIADRETGLGRDEINDGSGACGIYQHYPAFVFSSRYADNYGRKRWGPGPNACLHDRVNIITSLTMVNRGGWGPWGG